MAIKYDFFGKAAAPLHGTDFVDAVERGMLQKATMDQIDSIIKRTEYAAHGVALGDAAADQDLHIAAQKELAHRMGFE